MLSPDQVAPFLAQANRLVRRCARDYFRHCGDPAPVTADAVWAALDRLPEHDPVGHDELGQSDPHYNHRALINCFPHLPHTDDSVRRLCEAVAADPPDTLAEAYGRAARNVDLPALVRNRDRLLSCDGLDDEVRQHLEQRLHLAETSTPDTAWDRLMAAAAASEGKYLGELDADEVDAAVEAAAGHMDALAPRAMALLADDAVDDYRELFVIQMVGHARHAPAAGVLVDKLDLDEEDDGIHEYVPRALGRIGTDEAIDRLAALRPDATYGRLLSPGNALGRIKRPAAEAALVRLVAAERDEEVRVFLLNDLVDLASLAGLDAARLAIAADPRHPESIGLCERLLGVAAMHGVTLPEEKRWRERIDQHARQRTARMAQFDRGGLTAFTERMRQLGGLPPVDPEPADDDDDAMPPPPLPGEYDPYARLEPIRATGAKVGRNDPCPCGSGKKHKKCCGAPK